MTEESHDTLTDLLVQWEGAWERGENVSAERLCDEHPELLEPLRRQIERLKKMRWMSQTGDAGETDQSSPDPWIGRTLADRFTVESLLGSGGFGRIYRALDGELQRHVALKIARTDRVRSTDDLLHEARRAAKLRHPGIVTVHDVGRHDGTVFLVGDLVEGRSLADVIAEDIPSPGQAARWIADVADALQIAHDHEIVHRNIKPSNVLLDPRGKALVTDFGIAATVEQIHQGESPRAGTLTYMAPEQLVGESALIGPRTDIFSLGVVLYELLTGDHPFTAETEAGWRQNILLRTPSPPRAIRPDVPGSLSAICVRCLAKHPSERWDSAAALADALRSAPEKSPPVRRRWWLLGAPALLLFLGLPPVLWMGTAALLRESHESSSADLAGQLDDPQSVSEGLFFDGKHRIITPLKRTLPLTMEAWVRPRRQQEAAYFIGSDRIGEYGLSMGTSNSIFIAEWVRGTVASRTIVPVGRWSHVAAVFGTAETRLYVDGQLVGTGPPSAPGRDAPFVIGGIGYDSRLHQFDGEIRSVRISEGERFTDAFTPDTSFEPDAASSGRRTLLIYDERSSDGDVVRDLSGSGHDGRWEASRPADAPLEPVSQPLAVSGSVG